eukprot:gene3376-biopygen12004
MQYHHTISLQRQHQTHTRRPVNEDDTEPQMDTQQHRTPVRIRNRAMPVCNSFKIGIDPLLKDMSNFIKREMTFPRKHQLTDLLISLMDLLQSARVPLISQQNALLVQF